MNQFPLKEIIIYYIIILKYNIKLYTSMPKLVAGWVLGTHNFLIVRVQVSLLVILN